jgi:hypothetical protein
MPDSVIKRIEDIAEREKQEKTLVLSDRNVDPIGDNDDGNATVGVDDNYDNDTDDGIDNRPPGVLLNAPENEENETNDDNDSTVEVRHESAGVPDEESTGVPHEESTGVPENDITTDVVGN